LDAPSEVIRVAVPAAPLDLDGAHSLTRAIDAAAQCASARVVALLPHGADFCLGLAEGFEPLHSGLDPPAALARLRVPVVAGLRGTTASAGLELALAADVRIAAADTVLSLPDLRAGRLPCWGGTQRLVRCAGPTVATRMLLTGAQLTADEALAAGLVHEVVEGERLEERVTETSDGLAALAPLALAYAKEALIQGAHMPMVDALRLETDLNVLLQASTDRAEGLGAFLARRDPTFTGE
jgi:enoyl-CoA hydratase/carnithine racemase